MSVIRKDPEDFRRSAESEDIDRLYQSLSRLMLASLMKRYALDERAGIEMIADAFYAYMQVGVPTPDPEAWLSAAIWTHAEKLYGHRLTETAEDLAQTRASLAALHGIETLPPHAQTAIHLHIRGGLTYEQVAAEMNVTVLFAKRLIGGSIRKLLGLRPPVDL